MPVDLYNGFLMIVMALVILSLGFVTMAQSWKQGNFVSITAAVSLLFLGVAALIQQLSGLTNISLIAFSGAVIAFLFTLFVVAPMAFRRSKKKRPAQDN
jgi:hypothetical protein